MFLLHPPEERQFPGEPGTSCCRDTQAGGTCPKGGEGILALQEPWHIPLQSSQPPTTSPHKDMLLPSFTKPFPAWNQACGEGKGCLSPSQLAPRSAASAQQPRDDAVASECPQPLLCPPGTPSTLLLSPFLLSPAQSHLSHREWISLALSLPCPFPSC